MYHVFVRSWWKDSPGWPNGLEPCVGEKETLDTVETAREARELCAAYRADNAPGRYSRKAEFEEV
jgi:hypothetical protein